MQMNTVTAMDSLIPNTSYLLILQEQTTEMGFLNPDMIDFLNDLEK